MIDQLRHRMVHSTPIISLIVAVSANHAIGKNNQLLWHLPNDLKFFKKITTGHPVIMGRKTFESIGKPLPNRRNIVISRQVDFRADGIEVAPTIDEALNRCPDETEIFVIGGGEIYRQTLPRADRIYMTRVDTEIDGDAYFPVLHKSEWQSTVLEHHYSDDKHPYNYSFLRLDRVRADGSDRG